MLVRCKYEASIPASTGNPQLLSDSFTAGVLSEALIHWQTSDAYFCCLSA